MGEQEFVTVTAYETELVKVITVPSYYSLQEIREAVWAEMNESAVNRDLSSIVIASSEFLQNTYSTSLKCSKAAEKSKRTLQRKVMRSLRSSV